jgi:NDP-sugar pyrophosphorylase family protein
MRAFLLCPSGRLGLKPLSAGAPLAAVPMLGQSLLEYWLSHLAASGVGSVRVLAHDRPEQLSSLVGDGGRWGLSVEVLPEPRDLTPAEAMLKYAPELESAADSARLAMLDHFPGAPERPLFDSYAHWFGAVREWMTHAVTPDRVGIHEVRPGVWLGRHSHISPEAQLNPPCWVAERVFIGAGAVLGPNAVVEPGAFVEPGAEVIEGWVGPDTFVGELTRLKHSLAFGDQLIHWPSGTATTVFDPFLLCALRPARQAQGPGWFARAAARYARNREVAPWIWKHLLLHKEG